MNDLAAMIAPPAQLLTPVVDPLTKAKNYAFPLQTSAWLTLQDVVRQAIAFPATESTFTTLYGTFTDEAKVLDAVAILGRIQKDAQAYGDPSTLIMQLMVFQSADKPPESIYGHAVWLAAKTQTNAEQIVSLLEEGLKDIGDTQDPKVRLQELTELLTGTAGIDSIATTLNGYVTAFTTAATDFFTTLDADLTGPTDSLAVYLNDAGNVLSEAQGMVSADQKSINDLTSEIAELNKEYTGFTAAAGSSPALLLVPFIGVALAIADAATFTTLAIKVKAHIASLQPQLEQANEDYKLKAALVTELADFNAKTTTVGADGNDFLKALTTLSSGWTEFSTHITQQLGALTPADLADWSAFMAKVNLKTAIDGWHLIATKAEAFFTAGFVQFTSQS